MGSLRLRIFVGVVLLVVGALAVRLVQLQLFEGDRYEEAALDNAVRARRAGAPRGRVFDRNGTLLVGNEKRGPARASPLRATTLKRRYA